MQTAEPKAPAYAR